MRRLLRPVLIPLALLFLLEAWLWDRLAPIVALVVARLPFRALKAALAEWIERLPPAATLVIHFRSDAAEAAPTRLVPPAL